MKSINNINQLNKSDFLSVFGNIFEKTEWIAEKVFELKPVSYTHLTLPTTPYV